MVLQIMDTSPFVMKMYDEAMYTYPAEARAIGWTLALSSVLMIPLLAARALLATPKGAKGSVGIRRRLLISLSPAREEKDILEGKTASR